MAQLFPTERHCLFYFFFYTSIFSYYIDNCLICVFYPVKNLKFVLNLMFAHLLLVSIFIEEFQNVKLY